MKLTLDILSTLAAVELLASLIILPALALVSRR